MAIEVVGIATAEQGSGTSIVIPVPVEAQPGDLLLAVHGDQSNTSSGYNGHPDFTRLTPWQASDNDGRVIGIWGKVHTTGSSFQFARDGAATRSVGAIIAIRGQADTYLDDVVTAYAGSSITNGRRTEALTATVDGLQVFFARAEFTVGNSHVPTATPAGFTQDANWQTGSGTTGSRSGGWVGHRTVTPGSTGTSDITWASASGPSAQAVIIAAADDDPDPDPDPEPTPDATPLYVWTGTDYTPVDALVWNGSGYAPIQQGREVIQPPAPSGYTITQMDADIANGTPVYWAHRGGSLDWSEMTMHAYDNAIDHGAKCLEVSIHRAQGGVWIMAHDNNTNRVTGNSHNIVSTPYATLLGMPVTAPAPGGVLGRLEDLLTAYPDYVLLVDNKPNSWRPEEFFPMLKTVPNWADHIIVKFDGEHSASMGQAAKAAGFKTAVYVYDTNIDTHLAAVAPYSDYIGLNYDAPQGDWDTAASYGKPLWGHVLPNATAANTAASKGADIFQCADVTGIIPGA